MKTIFKEDSKGTYVSMKVKNNKQFYDFFQKQGIDTLNIDDFHCTIAYSKKKFNHIEDKSEVIIKPSSLLGVYPLGDEGAIVLKFDSIEMQERFNKTQLEGAIYDYPSYIPHITITYKGSELDLDSLKWPDFDIILWDETSKELDLNRKDKLDEVIYRDNARIKKHNIETNISDELLYKGKSKSLYNSDKYFYIVENDEVIFYIEYRFSPSFGGVVLGTRENLSNEKGLFFKVVYSLLYIGYKLKEDFQYNDLSINAIKKIIKSDIIKILYNNEDITQELIDSNFNDSDIDKTFIYFEIQKHNKKYLIEDISIFKNVDIFDELEYLIQNTNLNENKYLKGNKMINEGSTHTVSNDTFNNKKFQEWISKDLGDTKTEKDTTMYFNKAGKEVFSYNPKKETLIIFQNDLKLDQLEKYGMVKEGKETYKEFFTKKLKKYGVEAPDDLEGDEKKKFFDEVDAEWEGEKEEPEAGEKKDDMKESINEDLQTAVMSYIATKDSTVLQDAIEREFYSQLSQNDVYSNISQELKLYQ